MLADLPKISYKSATKATDHSIQRKATMNTLWAKLQRSFLIGGIVLGVMLGSATQCKASYYDNYYAFYQNYISAYNSSLNPYYYYTAYAFYYYYYIAGLYGDYYAYYLRNQI